jgi:hypothetical protein
VGAIVALQTVYDLGAEWYATRLDADWERATPGQAAATFKRFGLTGSSWSFAAEQLGNVDY